MGALLVSDTLNPEKVVDSFDALAVDPVTGGASGVSAGGQGGSTSTSGGSDGSAGAEGGDGVGGMTSSSTTMLVTATPLPIQEGGGGNFMVKLTAITPVYRETPQANFKRGMPVSSCSSSSSS